MIIPDHRLKAGDTFWLNEPASGVRIRYTSYIRGRNLFIMKWRVMRFHRKGDSQIVESEIPLTWSTPVPD